MKKLLFLSLIIAAMWSCSSDDNTSIGTEIQPQQDKITAKTDTFHLQVTPFEEYIISAQTDTIILGRFYDALYGETKAEVVAQFMPPIDYKFPDQSYNPTPDSLCLSIYYNTWFGEQNAPMELEVYYLDVNNEIKYDNIYFSDYEIEDYCTKTQRWGSALFTPESQANTEELPVYKYRVQIKFDSDKATSLFNLPASAYTSATEFHKHFRGLHVAHKYGSSSMINVARMNLELYYHYSYRDLEGQQTKISSKITYPANSEVRQLSKISHPDATKAIDILALHDSVSMIKSAGGSYPSVFIPTGKMNQRVKQNIGNKLCKYHSVNLYLETTTIPTPTASLSTPTYLLCIRESRLEEFVQKHHVPSSYDSIANIATYDSTNKRYIFDLTYMASKLSDDYPDQTDRQDELIIVPVDLSMDSDGNITLTKIQTPLAGTLIRSGKNSYSPPRIEMIYSGF